MSRLDEALARLERAVTRLEAAWSGGKGVAAGERRPAESDAETVRRRAAAGEIAARVDSALARVGRVLGGEGLR